MEADQRHCSDFWTYKVILVSKGIPADEVSKIGFKVFDNIDNALDIVLKSNDEDARIGVVTHGGDVMFRIDKVK